MREVSAEEQSQSGGGSDGGWVLLSGHDADGAAGINGPMNRWYGGIVAGGHNPRILIGDGPGWPAIRRPPG